MMTQFITTMEGKFTCAKCKRNYTEPWMSHFRVICTKCGSTLYLCPEHRGDYTMYRILGDRFAKKCPKCGGTYREPDWNPYEHGFIY